MLLPYAEVCFNDGNNNWDSRNGANYRFYKGTYTYSNGSMVLINSNPTVTAPSASAELSNLSKLSSEDITLGSAVKVKAGGSGDYTYTVCYKKSTANKWTVKQSYSSNALVTFKPAAATTYDVCVKVKDSTGTIVKKYFTVTVEK